MTIFIIVAIGLLLLPWFLSKEKAVKLGFYASNVFLVCMVLSLLALPFYMLKDNKQNIEFKEYRQVTGNALHVYYVDQE